MPTLLRSPDAILATLTTQAGLPPDAARYRLTEVARILDSTENTVLNLAKSGALVTILTTERRRLVTREALLDYLARLNNAPRAA
jgi:hypothetical protein